MIEAHAWNEKLDLSHEAIDHEHHLQIALVTAFADAVEQRRPWLARRLAEQLLRYSIVHFGSEELLMEASGDPARERHAGEHAAFLRRMRDLEGTDETRDGVGDEALADAIELRDALAAHMSSADRSLVDRQRQQH
jgi:hemerythrin